jgi:MscS family membrane protein
MDIFGRIGPPDPAAFPDVDMVHEAGTDSFRIPETPLRIVRMAEGGREGEFLFSNATVRAAPRFFAAVRRIAVETLDLSEIQRRLQDFTS